jgi:ribosomal protein S18 acetylase RimI-like enzyme
VADGDDFGLRPLQPEDRLGSIKSGDASFAPLADFAKKHAKKYEHANLARTYVVHELTTNVVLAFVTLVCSEIMSDERLVQEDGVEFPYKHYPAVKIARLLVDKRYRDDKARGFGRSLVELALGIARSEICPAVGCRFVVVDSKKQSVTFYEKCGFTLVDTADNRGRDEPVMFIDLHKAAA